MHVGGQASGETSAAAVGPSGAVAELDAPWGPEPEIPPQAAGGGGMPNWGRRGGGALTSGTEARSTASSRGARTRAATPSKAARPLAATSGPGSSVCVPATAYIWGRCTGLRGKGPACMASAATLLRAERSLLALAADEDIGLDGKPPMP